MATCRLTFGSAFQACALILIIKYSSEKLGESLDKLFLQDVSSQRLAEIQGKASTIIVNGLPTEILLATCRLTFGSAFQACALILIIKYSSEKLGESLDKLFLQDVSSQRLAEIQGKASTIIVNGLPTACNISL